MTEVGVFDWVGEFAEDKDKARDIRIKQIVPALDKGWSVILDFRGVNLATQSFVHALISEVIRTYGTNVLDQVLFKNCNDNLRALINIVVDYTQWGMGKALDEFLEG